MTYYAMQRSSRMCALAVIFAWLAGEQHTPVTRESVTHPVRLLKLAFYQNLCFEQNSGLLQLFREAEGLVVCELGSSIEFATSHCARLRSPRGVCAHKI